MPKGYSLEYNDFSGGLNTRLPASQIARNEAQTAVNVDLRSGALKTINDLGSALASDYLSSQASTFTSGKSLHFAASAYFMDDLAYTSTFTFPNPAGFYRTYLDDGDVTYFTNASTYPQKAVSSDSKAPVSLGIIAPDPPTNLAKSAGALTGRYKYAITFFTSDDVESNPTFFADISLSSEGISFTLPLPKNARVIGARIYRTRESEDVYFLVKEVYGVTAVTTVNVDTTGNETQPDIETQLTWAQGGFPASGGQYIEDHSPAPTLTVLSNKLHAGNATGKPGAGICFGATGATVRWSILGAPDYWPVVNEASLPGVCEALVSASGTTFAFTATGIFQLLGSSDDNILVQQTNAAHGVKPGTGHLVTDTPFGMLFQSAEGLAVFNGSSSSVFSTSKLALNTVEANTYHSAVFYDNQWFLFHTSGALVADLQDGLGNVRFWNYSPSSGSIAGAAVATFDAPIVADAFASPLGVLDEIIITDGGSGYQSVPTGSVTAPSGGVAGVVAFSASLERVAVTTAGAGYLTAPKVVVSPPTGFGGVQAQAVAFIANGSVVAVEVIEPGSGYTSAPSLTIDAAPVGGTNAVIASRLTITGARLTQTGFGFSTNPQVTVSGGTPDRAATAVGIIKPLGLYQHGSVRVGTKVYLMGGLAYTPAAIDTASGSGAGGSVGLNVLKYMQVYDTATRQWSALPSMPVAMHSIMPITDGTNIWVWRGADGTSDAGSSTAALYKYDVAGVAWSTVAAASGTPPATGLSGHAAWYASLSGSGYMYIWGGFNNTSALPTTYTLFRVNLSTRVWEQRIFATTPAPSAYSAVAVVGSNVYVFGGRDAVDQTDNTNGGMFWTKFALNATMASTTGATAFDTTILTRDSSTASTITVAGTTYIIVYGGQTIRPSPEIKRTFASMWVFNSSTDAFIKQANSVIGINELRGHTMTQMSDSSVLIYGGVSANTTASPESTGFSFSPRGIFDPNTVTAMYVTQGSGSSWSVKQWASASPASYLAMQWCGRDETAPLPGVRHVFTRFRMDYEGDPQLSVVTDGTDRPGGGNFFFDGSSSASRTQARQWFPSTSATTRPDGRRLAVQFKSPGAQSNDTVVYRFEVDGKYDGS